MNIYAPKNYIGSSYFPKQTSLKSFLLHIFDVVQNQIAENVELIESIDPYLLLFYTFIYFKPKEHIATDARSPPFSSFEYCEVL
jgi:hypothetical protein